MPFLEGNKLRKQRFKLLERMSKHNISPEAKSGGHTKTFSTLKGLTKTGIKLQKHGKHPKKLEIKVQHTPPDAKLLAKYEHQLIDLSSSQCNETDSVDHDVAIEKPGRTCQDHCRETNTKGKVRPIPTPRKIVSIPSSSSFIQIREPEENPELSSSSFIQIREPEENPELSSSSLIQIREPEETPELDSDQGQDEEESDSPITPTFSAVPQPPPTFVPNHLHMTKSMSLPRPRKLPLSPCPSRPPPISFKINSTSSPEPPTMTETSDFSTRVRSMTLPRLGPKSLPPEHHPQNVNHTTKTAVTPQPDSFSNNSSSFLTPALGLKPRSSTLKPQQQPLAPAPGFKPKSSTLKPQHQPWTCRDVGSPQKKNECFVPSGRFTLTLGRFYTNNSNYFVDLSFNASSRLLSIFYFCMMQFLMLKRK